VQVLFGIAPYCPFDDEQEFNFTQLEFVFESAVKLSIEPQSHCSPPAKYPSPHKNAVDNKHPTPQ
jgi:hypothetical protein